MRRHAPLRCGALTIAAVVSVLCADTAQWGAVHDDLRLGIGVATAPEPSLGVLLKNMRAEERALHIGIDGPVGPAYNVTITARAPHGKPEEVFDSNVLRLPPEGLMLPKIAHIDPGRVQEFLFPMRHLFCIINKQNIPLQTLLAEGYTVQATFDDFGAHVTSPEFSLPK